MDNWWEPWTRSGSTSAPPSTALSKNQNRMTFKRKIWKMSSVGWWNNGHLEQAVLAIYQIKSIGSHKKKKKVVWRSMSITLMGLRDVWPCVECITAFKMCTSSWWIESQDIKSGLLISLFKEKAKNKKTEGLKNEPELSGLVQGFPCFCPASLQTYSVLSFIFHNITVILIRQAGGPGLVSIRGNDFLINYQQW